MFVIGRSLSMRNTSRRYYPISKGLKRSVYLWRKSVGKKRKGKEKENGRARRYDHIHLLKEVLDEFNVTYRASEKKADLIAKVRQAPVNLQNNAENFQHYPEAPLRFGMSNENGDTTSSGKSHWHNRFTFSASPFPLIYYDERRERFLHILFQLIFLLDSHRCVFGNTSFPMDYLFCPYIFRFL